MTPKKGSNKPKSREEVMEILRDASEKPQIHDDSESPLTGEALKAAQENIRRSAQETEAKRAKANPEKTSGQTTSSEKKG